jgi:hypothetical protein
MVISVGRRRKMNKRITCIILMICFVITLAVPTSTVQAATNYSKVNKTYSIGALYPDNDHLMMHDDLKTGYTDVYKLKNPGIMYLYFMSADDQDYSYCLMNKSGKKIFESKNASKKEGKILDLERGTYYLKVKANKKSWYQLRMDQCLYGEGLYNINPEKYKNQKRDYIYPLYSEAYMLKPGESVKLSPGLGKVKWIIYSGKKYTSLSTTKGKTCEVTALKEGETTIIIKTGKIWLYYFITVKKDCDSKLSDTEKLNQWESGDYDYNISMNNSTEKTIREIKFSFYQDEENEDGETVVTQKKKVDVNVVVKPHQSIRYSVILKKCRKFGLEDVKVKDMKVTYTDGTTKTFELNQTIGIERYHNIITY